MFLNGVSVVADEAYIRRSTIDHNSDEEFVPGYHGTLDKVAMLSHPNAALRTSYREAEAERWEAVVGWDGLRADEVDALVAFIKWLSPGTWPRGSARLAEIVPLDSEHLRKEIELRLESIHLCYEVQLEGEPGLQGLIMVEPVGLPGGRLVDGRVILDTVHNPMLARCVADAVGDATAACPVPPEEGAVTFVFAPNDEAPEPPPNAIPLRLIW
jgi:hypothetical protein